MSASQASRRARAAKAHHEIEAIRHTIESIGIAIVLAFVLRAFLVEAFVIPTGSMAPGLMGEHFDLTCSHCGYEFDFGYLGPGLRRQDTTTPITAYCPNCRRAYPKDQTHETHVNGGDRVLVLKFVYDFSDPKPWDVVVFRNPQNNRENFIKRLVGLPGETIEIVRGDVWVKARNDDAWRIRRKPAKVQEAMWTVIYDNDYPVADAATTGPRPRWIPAAQADTPFWDLTADQGRRFQYAGGRQRASLTFEGDEYALFPFFAYNKRDENDRYIGYRNNRDICTDLQLSAVFVPQASDSRIALRVDAMDQRLVADVNADGTMRLWRQPRGDDSADGREAWFAAGKWTLWQEEKIPPLTPGQGYALALANVDFRLSLTVDGRHLLTSTDQQYPADRETVKGRLRNDEPIPMTGARIDAGGGPCELLHVRLDRDAYYTNAVLDEPVGITGRYANEYPDINDPEHLRPWRYRPGWGVFDNPITLKDDAFFVLGDNSPQSLDSRRWVQVGPTVDPAAAGPVAADDPSAWQYQMGTVPRSNMIGKAMFVYWPAGHRPPVFNSLPLIPNVGKMRLIR